MSVGKIGLSVAGTYGTVPSQPKIAFVPNSTVRVSLSASVARANRLTLSVKSYLPDPKNEEGTTRYRAECAAGNVTTSRDREDMLKEESRAREDAKRGQTRGNQVRIGVQRCVRYRDTVRFDDSRRLWNLASVRFQKMVKPAHTGAP